MNRFGAESRKTEVHYLGDSLVPEPVNEPVNQVGGECVLRAILYGGQMEMRRVWFGKGDKCDLVFDYHHFSYLYERESRVPLMYDRSRRIGRGLTIFKDMGIKVMSATTISEQLPVVRLIDFKPYPPKVDPTTGKLTIGLQFHEVMEILHQDKPVLGSFAVDRSFSNLGPEEIYDFRPSDPSKCDTHCVMFIDGGYDAITGRNYLKFLNSHGPGFGANGFGRVFFDLIYQANSEYCFHTLSFEDKDPPTSQQPTLAHPISASSTTDSVAETHDKQKQFGVTPAALMDPLTESDHKRTDELHENFEDSAMREKALSNLAEIVKACVEHIAVKDQTIEMPKIQVLTSGSYSLQVHIPSDELEVLCLGPPDVSREELFETLHDALRKVKELADLEPVQKEEMIYKECSAAEEAVDRQRSASRVMKFKLHGIQIVLFYATISEVPAECSDIFQDSVLSCIDEANIPNLDRCRSARKILELVPDIKHFQSTVRYVNFWARRRSLYSKMPRFLGGTHWEVMVARVCQLYPSAVPSVLVMKVFEEYSRWFWPSPVMLSFIDNKLPFYVWNAPGNKLDEAHVMPIITPAHPCRNSSADVSNATLLMLKREFVLGFEICQKIKKGEADWSALYQPVEFFKLYSRYLQLEISIKDTNDLRIWKVKVEPLWRELPMKIAAHGKKATRGHLHPYEYYDDSRMHCYLFIGLEKISSGDHVVLGNLISTPMPVDKEVLSLFREETDKLKGPGMEIQFSHFLQQRMEGVLSNLVSDCASSL